MWEDWLQNERRRYIKNGWSCTAKTKDKTVFDNPNGEFKRVEDGRAYANRKKMTWMQKKKKNSVTETQEREMNREKK